MGTYLPFEVGRGRGRGRGRGGSVGNNCGYPQYHMYRYGIATGRSFKNRTRTHTTHSPKTAGIPVPVPNPMRMLVPSWAHS